MRRLSCLGRVIAVLLATPGAVAAQSLAERVRTDGCTEQIVQREFGPVTLAEAARGAELIGEVYVTGTKSWLSKEQDEIFTDATVRVMRVWKRTEGAADAGASIVIRRPGGTLTIEDRVVRGVEADFPPFVDDEQYVLFLRRDPRTGVYFPPHGAQSAFRISGGAIQQVTQAFASWQKSHGALPIATFRQLLVEQVALLPSHRDRPGTR